MKKVLSFVCCLFMAFFCFVPLVAAGDMPMHDGEHCFFKLAAAFPHDMRLATHRGSCDGVYGAAFGVLGYRYDCPWFTADDVIGVRVTTVY